jgi:dienelactone hydrolase
MTNHPELKTAPLIVLGFSGAGALAGRLVGFAPDRIEAAILSHGGQVAPLNLDTISLSGAALKIPELILVGGNRSAQPGCMNALFQASDKFCVLL